MTFKLLKIFCLCLLLLSCEKKEEQKSAPKEETPAVKLEKASFKNLNGWKKDNLQDAITAFKKSCERINSSSAEYLGNAEVKIKTSDYAELCRKLNTVHPKDYRKYFENNFTPWLVTYNGTPQGKFTSYYESELHASYQKSDKYKYPVYGRPNDLIEVNLQEFDPSLPAKRLIGRIEKQKLVPYFTRDEINNQDLNAPVILWSDNYVDIYVMQIQGSAVATLDDGSKIRIGYAENNGRDFKGIGSILLEQGLIKPGQASMGHIKKWLKENFDQALVPMNKNHRYVFHRLLDSDGPIGAQGVSLTAGRSLAVDKTFIPLGSLLWLETTGPDKEKINKLVVAQDIGGAIKGAVRGDYFWGSGGDDILEKAGRMHAAGQYYILLPKNAEVK